MSSKYFKLLPDKRTDTDIKNIQRIIAEHSVLPTAYYLVKSNTSVTIRLSV